jgi:eukaryotic-like serine/threonine-protein kinase
VELVHEILLQKVPPIVEWIERERAVLEGLTDLEASAQVWEREGSSDDLPTGTLLKHYRKAAGVLSSRTLQASRSSERAVRYLEAARRLERRRTRLRWTIWGAALGAMFLIMFTAGLLFLESNHVKFILAEFVKVTDGSVGGADWKLGRRAHTLEARRELLDVFAAGFDKLSKQDPDDLPVLLGNVTILHRQSDLAFHDGTLDVADRLLGEALELLQQGRRLHGDDLDLLFQLGLNESKRGKVAQARGKWELARKHFLQANEHFMRPPPSHNPEDHRRTQATSYSELGQLELTLGKPRDALAWFDKAIELWEMDQKECPDPDPDQDPYDCSLFAEALGWRAKAFRVVNLESAEQDFQRSLRMARKIHDKRREDSYFKWVLAQILVWFADFQLARGERDAAAAMRAEALGLARDIHDGERPNKRYALVLAESLLGNEELARLRAEEKDADAFQRERCGLLNDFMRNDSGDVRFGPDNTRLRRGCEEKK